MNEVYVIFQVNWTMTNIHSVHATLSGAETQVYTWNRELWGGSDNYREQRTGKYDVVFVGHNPEIVDNEDDPLVRKGKVINLDNGGAYPRFGGRICVCNIETLEYWRA